MSLGCLRCWGIEGAMGVWIVHISEVLAEWQLAGVKILHVLLINTNYTTYPVLYRLDFHP
jgi:hypothetical protein